MLSLDQLTEFIESDQVDTVLVAFTDLYGRMMGKRFDASHFLDFVADAGTHACDYLLTVDMEMEPVPGYEFANWEQGYGDVHLAPDLTTLRVAAWLDRTALVLCDVVDESTHTLVDVAPRSLLRKQLESCATSGFTLKGASELEYYLLQNSYREAAESGHRDLTPAGWYIEDYHAFQGQREEHFNAAVRRSLAQSGVPVESTKGEWGLGQHELNLRYCECLEMADRHAIYKQCARETADRLGVSVTFMAKYSQHGAGSSCHVHLSLWNKDGNAFRGDQQLGSVQCSDYFRWFLGGWMAHLPDLMVFYAPTVNSYKRYRSSSWAPTRIAWSYDNRTAGFRVVGREDSLRIECRVPGADCNPYLTYAAAIASGMDGIANRIEPPDAFDGNVYRADHAAHVPKSLAEAAERFSQSSLARRAFGKQVVQHYAHFFQTEQSAFDRSVTDWERTRYFERI